MKKILLSAIAIMAFGFANAQEETTSGPGFAQGDLFLSGSANFNSTKTDGSKAINGFEVSPRIGYFVTDNIAVGVGLGYGETDFEILSNIEKVQAYSAEAFARYYVTPANRFSLFGELAAGYNHAKNKTTDTKADGFEVRLAPGVSYFVSDHFALEASFGLFSYENNKLKGGDSTNAYNFGFDLNNINLGLVYKF